MSWPAGDALYGVTVAVDSWEQRGSLDGTPEALTAADAATVHAATDRGIYTSTDAGRSRL